MFKNQKLVFSRRLTTDQLKKIEAMVEDTPGVWITDVKTHSLELTVEFNMSEGFVQPYNVLINNIYNGFKFGNAISLDGEGYILVFQPNSQLQSDAMKQHGINKAGGLFNGS